MEVRGWGVDGESRKKIAKTIKGRRNGVVERIFCQKRNKKNQKKIKESNKWRGDAGKIKLVARRKYEMPMNAGKDEF